MHRLAPLVSDRVVVVTNDGMVAAAVNATSTTYLILPDRWPEGGALGGVATGLTACAGWAMVVACDMPLVDPVIFAKLIDIARKAACAGCSYSACGWASTTISWFMAQARVAHDRGKVGWLAT